MPRVVASDVYSIEEIACRRENGVSIVVPIYKNAEVTLRCILSCLVALERMPGAQLYLINDASPEREIKALLSSFMEHQSVHVLENQSNLGFVHTVNRGVELAGNHDVILVNSDVVVSPDCFETLALDAYSNKRIATVSPFSNNATICSFPEFPVESTTFSDQPLIRLWSAFNSARLPLISAPTGVGFCLYIKRRALIEIGQLDAKNFPRGYGEENDFCQRAIAHGWMNAISANCYAHHEGSISFGSQKDQLIERAMQTLDRIYPTYHQQVAQFISADPLVHHRLLRYLQVSFQTASPIVLHVLHNLGGGVRQHVDELKDVIAKKIISFELLPLSSEACLLRIGHPNRLFSVSFPQGNFSELLLFLQLAGIDCVHFHQTSGFDASIYDLPLKLSCKSIITAHDFQAFFGTPTLTDSNGRFDNAKIETGVCSIPRAILDSSLVIFPSLSTKEIVLQKIVPSRHVTTPHPEPGRNTASDALPFKRKKSYTIAAVGALGLEKGADRLEAVAKELAPCGKFQVKLIGYAYRLLTGVTTTGPYNDADLKDIIRSEGADILLFTALWPETYSYTLSYAIDSGLPIIAPRIGAFSERTAGRPNVFLYDIDVDNDKLAALVSEAIAELEELAVIPPNEQLVVNYLPDFYVAPYLNEVGLRRRISHELDFTYISGLQVTAREVEKATFREKIFIFLWRYSHTFGVAQLLRLLPFGLKRYLKRSLTRRSVIDVRKRVG
ncbi:glycosyltransferase [Allohahella sp. A8]|uniref:glycosyltransferase n=1 Tax=Allohahella sp. A8 TaxID=3141461 RepID=UPI003A807960